MRRTGRRTGLSERYSISCLRETRSPKPGNPMAGKQRSAAAHRLIDHNLSEIAYVFPTAADSREKVKQQYG